MIQLVLLVGGRGGGVHRRFLTDITILFLLQNYGINYVQVWKNLTSIRPHLLCYVQIVKRVTCLRWLWSGSELQLLGAAESRAQCGGQREHHLAAAETALPPVREPGLLQPGGAWNRARLQNRRRSILCRQSTVQDHGTRLILQVCL